MFLYNFLYNYYSTGSMVLTTEVALIKDKKYKRKIS